MTETAGTEEENSNLKQEEIVETVKEDKHFVKEVDVIVKTPGKRGRKRKDADAKDKSNKKVYTKRKEKAESPSIKESPVESEVDDEDDPYAVNSQVFARWGDGTGVYFYPAIITQVISKEEVKVLFLEDKISKKCRKETEIVTARQMIPGTVVTVTHDVYLAYSVTAALMKYPEKRENTLEYEVQITATDSEPQNNEDSRVVLHKDISLTGNN